eukprot:5760284-Amphidinium_carterae.1
MSRIVFYGYIMVTARRFRNLKPERIVAVWEAIRLWIDVGGYTTRTDFSLGMVQGMPSGPDTAMHARMMHFAVAALMANRLLTDFLNLSKTDF